MSWRFWVEWARRFRWQLVLIGGLTGLSSVATLAVPWLAAQLLGGLATDPSDVSNATGFSQIIILLVGALFVLTALNIAASIVSERASLQILTELRTRIYNHVQAMRLSFHDASKTGDILALTSYEVGSLSDFLASTIANAPAMILTAIGAILILFWIDPIMAIIVPLLVPFFAILARLAGRRLRILSGEVRSAEANLTAIAERDLEMLPAIKAFAVEEHHRDEFAHAADRSRQLGFSLARLNAFVGPIMALVAALTAIAVLVFGSEALANGERTPTDLFAFLLYAALLTQPVGRLAAMYGAYQMARGTLARLEGVLGIQPEDGYSAGQKLNRATGALRVDDLSFAYEGRAPVFNRMSLSIRAGETVAITGENGVGKSTLVRLLLRFYQPISGTISLDDTDITSLDVQDLRRQFGYVPQRPLLFNGTVAENIVFGQSEAVDLTAVTRAAKASLASDFIEALPDGFDTQIGDHGVRLSGGQRQRIALARALYRDPPIYILDEATSMYDLESEAAFVEGCIETLKDRTVILITHRPASLALAERVLKLDAEGVHEIAKP